MTETALQASMRALHTARSPPSTSGDETQAQLEETAFLFIVAGLFRDGISGISYSRSTAVRDKIATGRIRTGAVGNRAVTVESD